MPPKPCHVPRGGRSGPCATALLSRADVPLCCLTDFGRLARAKWRDDGDAVAGSGGADEEGA